MKVALVVMPWVDAGLCPLGAAGLKAYLQAHGVETDAHYFNLRLADRLGPGLYTMLARGSSLWPEWFFAYHLFGPGGDGQLRESFDDVARLPSFRSFAAETGVPLGRLERLLLDDVPAFLDDCVSRVSWKDYGLVGFSSTMCSHLACLALSRRLKERFGPPIAFGGPNVEGEMGPATMEGCPWIDHVVDGEGEEPLLELARALARGGRGLAARLSARKPVDLAKLPAPDHGDFFETLRGCPNLPGEPAVTVETSRGCWWGQKSHCTFCGIPDAALAYRALPARAAARRIWELHERYGAGRVYAADLIMSVDHLRDLLPELERLRREHDSDLRLFYETKANLTRAQLEAMSRAGIAELQAGIESLSTPALRRMRKGVRAIQNAQTLKWGLASGIKVVWNYLYGFPGERAAEHERAAEAVLALTHLQPPAGCGPVRPDRFSPFHERPREFGLDGLRPDPVYRRLYPAGRFELSRLAYGFEFPRPARAPARLRAAVSFWGEVFPRNFLASRRGVGRVELFDARPLSVGGAPRYRESVLTGVEAAAYRACETVRTFGQILEVCRREIPACSAARLRRALGRLAAERLVMREEEFHLALAVPVAGLPAAQRALFETFQAAGRRALAPAFSGRVPLA